MRCLGGGGGAWTARFFVSSPSATSPLSVAGEGTTDNAPASAARIADKDFTETPNTSTSQRGKARAAGTAWTARLRTELVPETTHQNRAMRLTISWRTVPVEPSCACLKTVRELPLRLS